MNHEGQSLRTSHSLGVLGRSQEPRGPPGQQSRHTRSSDTLEQVR